MLFTGKLTAGHHWHSTNTLLRHPSRLYSRRHILQHHQHLHHPHLTPRRALSLSNTSQNNNPEAFLERSPEGITFLSLNRPQAKNAISMKLLEDLRVCIDTVNDDRSARTLILRSSTPTSFCAGADLSERLTMTPSQIARFLLDLRNALSALENLPIPTIAAIDGPALGGGLEMALACDFRVVGFGVTKIGLPETKLGIIPGAGGTQRLTRLLGLSKAKELIFTGRMLTAQEAHDIGVVDYISEPTQSASDRAVQVALGMSSSAPLALRAAKLALSRAPELGLESGLDFERACYQTLLGTKDRVEALQAFKEKRKPVFKGE